MYDEDYDYWEVEHMTQKQSKRSAIDKVGCVFLWTIGSLWLMVVVGIIVGNL